MTISRTFRRRLSAAVLACALGGTLWLAPSASPSVSALRQRIAQAGAREQSLAAGAASSGRVIGALDGQLRVLAQRLADVQALLSADRARLVALSADTRQQGLVAARLRQRYGDLQRALARWLLSAYENGQPTVLDILVNAHTFTDLIERVDFIHRLSTEGATITQRTGTARDAANAALRRLQDLTAEQQTITQQVTAESGALSGINAALTSRRAAVAQARALAVAELRSTRADRQRLQGQLNALLTPPPSVAPAGTSFAIPWAIVQCESGGQNLPPNSAGASGYYQILPATWKQYGGSTAQAYQASKAEQDQVANRIWNGGAGASQWTCAQLVGAA